MITAELDRLLFLPCHVCFPVESTLDEFAVYLATARIMDKFLSAHPKTSSFRETTGGGQGVDGGWNGVRGNFELDILYLCTSGPAHSFPKPTSSNDPDTTTPHRRVGEILRYICSTTAANTLSELTNPYN